MKIEGTVSQDFRNQIFCITAHPGPIEDVTGLCKYLTIFHGEIRILKNPNGVLSPSEGP